MNRSKLFIAALTIGVLVAGTPLLKASSFLKSLKPYTGAVTKSGAIEALEKLGPNSTASQIASVCSLNCNRLTCNQRVGTMCAQRCYSDEIPNCLEAAGISTEAATKLHDDYVATLPPAEQQVEKQVEQQVKRTAPKKVTKATPQKVKKTPTQQYQQKKKVVQKRQQQAKKGSTRRTTTRTSNRY